MVTCLLYVFSCILCVCVCVLWGIVSLLWVFSVFYSDHFPFLSLPHPLPPSKKENDALMFSLLIKDTWIPLEWWKHEPQFPSHISLWFRSRNLLEIITLFLKWTSCRNSTRYHLYTILPIALLTLILVMTLFPRESYENQTGGVSCPRWHFDFHFGLYRLDVLTKNCWKYAGINYWAV